MRRILLSALFAVGIGLTGVSGASAAPAAAMDGAANNPLLQLAQVIVVEPNRRHRCRSVRVCRVSAYGHRRCRWERVCRR